MNLPWDESPHWTKPRVPDEPVAIHIYRQTAKEIAESIQDDPRYNAINPSQQAHIISMAIEKARLDGMLIEEGELING